MSASIYNSFIEPLDESLRPYPKAGPLRGFFLTLAPSIFIPVAEAFAIRLRKTSRYF
jgi:hypothetical protein